VDFEYGYTEEQEQFRKEVRAWMESNVPEEMKEPINRRADFTEAMFEFWKPKFRELAAKDWLLWTCTFPKEYGGGGRSAAQETILAEEFYRYRIPRISNYYSLPILLVWGTEEQKQQFLVPLLKAEKFSWWKLTEPHSGADLASYQSRAVRDGDDWLLSGTNVFISGRGMPDWLFGPMLTDPDAPRHRNLGLFFIPCPSPGLEIRTLNLLNGDEQHFIFMDNVRVPGNHLIGGDHQGWQVANTGLEQEHGSRGQAFPADPVVDSLVTYMQERSDDDPVRQQVAVSARIDGHVHDLFSKRTYWMYMSRLEVQWEGPTSSLFGREYGLRNAGRVRDVMGMYSLLGTHDSRAPHQGLQEAEQRNSLQHQHGAGSLNINKVIVARRIGISRTQERAARTPMTATGRGG